MNNIPLRLLLADDDQDDCDLFTDAIKDSPMLADLRIVTTSASELQRLPVRRDDPAICATMRIYA